MHGDRAPWLHRKRPAVSARGYNGDLDGLGIAAGKGLRRLADSASHATPETARLGGGGFY